MVQLGANLNQFTLFIQGKLDLLLEKADLKNPYYIAAQSISGRGDEIYRLLKNKNIQFKTAKDSFQYFFLFISLRRLDKAHPFISFYKKESPLDEFNRQAIAYDYYLNGDYLESISILKQTQYFNGQYSDLLEFLKNDLLSYCYLKQKNFNEAKNYYLKASKLSENKIQIFAAHQKISWVSLNMEMLNINKQLMTILEGPNLKLDVYFSAIAQSLASKLYFLMGNLAKAHSELANFLAQKHDHSQIKLTNKLNLELKDYQSLLSQYTCLKKIKNLPTFQPTLNIFDEKIIQQGRRRINYLLVKELASKKILGLLFIQTTVRKRQNLIYFFNSYYSMLIFHKGQVCFFEKISTTDYSFLNLLFTKKCLSISEILQQVWSRNLNDASDFKSAYNYISSLKKKYPILNQIIFWDSTKLHINTFFNINYKDNTEISPKYIQNNTNQLQELNIRQIEIIKSNVKQWSISQYQQLFKISRNTATRDFQKLVKLGFCYSIGKGPARRYLF